MTLLCCSTQNPCDGTVSKLCRGKTAVLETEVGLYTSQQSAVSPKNIQVGIFHISKLEG
jgi:hypothetical protein